MTVAQLQKSLKDRNMFHPDDRELEKAALQKKLEDWLKTVKSRPRNIDGVQKSQDYPQQSSAKSTTNTVCTLKSSTKFTNPVALCHWKSKLFVSDMPTGKISILKLEADGVNINALSLQTLACPQLFGLFCPTFLLAGYLYSAVLALCCVSENEEEIWNASPSQLIVNGSNNCNQAHGVSDFGDDQVVFTDTGYRQIKKFSLTRSNEDNNRGALKVTVLAGSGIAGTRDGSCAEFRQPTGICIEGKTCFVADTAVGRLRMVTDPPALLKFLAPLNTFAREFSEESREIESVTLQNKSVLSSDIQASKSFNTCGGKFLF